MLKGVSLLLSISMALGLSSCAARTEEQPLPGEEEQIDRQPIELSQQEFILPWYRSEGYNPYMTNNSLTLQLSDLLFEKLVVIDPNGELEWRALTGYSIQGLSVTLKVNTSLCYTDGTHIGVQDVAAVLQAARVSSMYGARFSNVENVTVPEGSTDTVEITLYQPDVRFCWLLDIPVMPAEQVTAQKPMTSARYTYAKDADALVPDPLRAELAPFDRIELWEMTGKDALSGSMNIGAISLYATEDESCANGMGSSRQAGFYTNTLVFLGFNAHTTAMETKYLEDGTPTQVAVSTGVSPLVASATGRQIINSLLDRTQLLEKVYYNQGHVATGFFNTVGAAAGDGMFSASAQPEEVQQKLEQLGYTLGMDDMWYLPPEEKKTDAGSAEDTQQKQDSTENSLTKVNLRLVVYSGSSYKRYLAQMVADTLTSAGLQVELIECVSMENYLQKLNSKEFDMYIGEIKLYNNMDLGAFFKPDGAAAFCLQLPETLTQAYARWRAGSSTTSVMESLLTKEMPWAPLLWRSGMLYYSKKLTGFTPSESSVFYGMENISLAAEEVSETDADIPS